MNRDRRMITLSFVRGLRLLRADKASLERRVIGVATSAILFAWLAVAAPAQEKQATADESTQAASAERLQELVSELRAEKKLVGLGAMLMVDGKIVASAVAGERQKGSGVGVDVGDRWHIGSITKSMTATMIARLVENNILDWSTTIGECFADSIDVHENYREVTLEQLLTHTAGAPANFPASILRQHPPEGPERAKAREDAVAAILTEAPINEPGKAFAYSNVGFTIAAAMAEAKTGKSWEQLMRDEFFRPLELNHAGFGPPQDGENELSQPRGHQVLGPMKRPVSQDADNSPIMGPAGIVHMTLGDLCNYGHDHLLGEQGKGRLLSEESYRKLHTPKLNNYACGWVIFDEERWPDGRLIWHNGSNTLWYALVAILPEQNSVVAVTSNDGDLKNAEAAAFQIVRELSQVE